MTTISRNDLLAFTQPGKPPINPHNLPPIRRPGAHQIYLPPDLEAGMPAVIVVQMPAPPALPQPEQKRMPLNEAQVYVVFGIALTITILIMLLLFVLVPYAIFFKVF
jgi:hypothetical protein